MAITFIILFSYSFGILQTNFNWLPYRLKGSYFKTEEFTSEVERFLNLFSEIYLDKNESIKIESDDIMELKNHYDNIVDNKISKIEVEYESKIAEASNNNAFDYAQELLRERNEKMEEIRKKYEKPEEELEKELINTKTAELEKNLENTKSRFWHMQNYIKYYIEEGNGKVYSNVPENVLYADIRANSLYMREFPCYTKANDNMISINRFFITRNLKGFIAIPKDEHSLIAENAYDYKNSTIRFLVYLLLSLSILVFSLILGFKKRKDILEVVEPLRKYYNSLPIDIRLLGLIMVLFFSNTITIRFYLTTIYKDIIMLIIYSLFLGMVVLQIYFLLPMFKSTEILKSLWKESILWRIKGKLENSLLFKSVVFKLLFIMGSIFALGMGAIVVLKRFEFIILYFPVALILGGGILYYVFSKLGYFNIILKSTEEVLNGNLNNQIELKGKGPLRKLAVNINKMQEGVDNSKKSQIKSERLKTELISNVSHDLRTPLTSIMNYTELLKSKDITEEDRKKYIGIIDKKSKRLKVLIDDLFEVSKMATGNIELFREKIDIVQLTKQALGEHDEKIKKSSLDFRVTSLSPHVYAWVDGRKMWRVFDNIISNILKYSLDNTRVYINSTETDKDITITFKNISNYELEENIEELFERFKRGDTSRNTEGSGLGLAIAKSIVDCHGGELNIELDGDLFKTIIKLNK